MILTEDLKYGRVADEELEKGIKSLGELWEKVEKYSEKEEEL